MVWVQVLSCNSEAETYTHSSESPCIKSLASLRAHENLTTDVESVRPFSHEDELVAKFAHCLLNTTQRVVIVHRF
jgi:hypothetical protein